MVLREKVGDKYEFIEVLKKVAEEKVIKDLAERLIKIS